MRKLFGAFLALGLMLSGVFGVAAQDAGSSYAPGVGSSATWTDDRGNAVAELAVTDVVADWSDYDEYSAPARGYLYYAVTFTVTNTDGGTVPVERNRFSLLDNTGLNSSASYASVAEGATTQLLEEDTDLADGETAEFTLVFQLFADVTPSLFVWQPDSGRIVLVNIDDGSAETNAAAVGLNTPATWVDERGSEVATFEVLEVNEDWQDFGEYEAPDRGSAYIAITFRVTNLSDGDLEINPFDLSMVDSESANNGRSYARGNEEVEDTLFADDVVLAPGESYEGIVVFELFGGVTPVAMVWQPEWGYLNVVILEGGSEAAPAASPEGETDEDDANSLEDELEALATPGA